MVDKVWLHKIFIEKPGSCLVLSESNCKKVKIIEINGQKVAVANLVKGSILFSPTNGNYNAEVVVHNENETDNKKWDYGTNIEKVDSNNTTTYSFLYSKSSEIKNNNANIIEKGKQFGTVNDTKLNYYNQYNFVFNIYQTDEKFEITQNNDLLSNLFKK